MVFGSSPRMRGTFDLPSLQNHWYWFIPADVGNMYPVKSQLRTSPVHPRGCGEHPWPPRPGPPTLGSSPRMRGTSYAHHVHIDRNRFIPADAGNIPPLWINSIVSLVHPRGCGEHTTSVDQFHCFVGSSPRMRGTSFLGALLLAKNRFIPADAGNIPSITPLIRPTSVHPRGCGEHYSMKCWQKTLIGSSPRMRGTYPGTANRGTGTRFIPADAGNIISIFTISDFSTVHPRGCGEHAA